MKNTLKNIFIEADKNYKIIAETYKVLEKSFDRKIQPHSAGQWILDNMYIIEQQYAEIIEAKKSLKHLRLPVIKTVEGSKYISIYYLAYELVEQNTGYIDQNIIKNCLIEHQKTSYLTSKELDLFILMIKIGLLKFISRVATNICHAQMQKIIVEDILKKDTFDLDKLYNDFESEYLTFRGFKDYLLDETRIKNANTPFVEYMAYRLKELGKKGEKYYELLKTESERIGFTVDEAIIKEHMEVAKTTDYMGRAILSYKQLVGINFREIFEAVNKVDATLKEGDYTQEFKKCDYKTKTRYRNYIIKLAKKYNVSELYVAKKAVDCSQKYKKHVGFFLCSDEKYLLKKEMGKSYFAELFNIKVVNKIKPVVYVLSILILALELTIIFCTNFIDFSNTTINIISYIIAYGFFMEISEKLINYFIRKTMVPEILPRFDFAKTVDEKYPTYVIMPTIISSIEKLDDMIAKMEITYLANRTENMYYMLIGDCLSSDKEHFNLDDKIVEYAKEKLDELNKKYNTPHKLFNFIYRKRVYSKAEGTYMGWERKRGAISEFNKLVLGKLTKEEKDKKFTIIYDDIIKAKYAITIDEDTNLSLNTAKDLVAIISHPLNRPKLSKNKKIVKKGYGIICPAVGLDIEAANKSIFSKIFGGFGGLDIYTTAVANVYQDVFGEAIFCGKGVYDIELFEKLLSDEIPENLVLSHDLLEGSYLRAGLASDIEVQDGFPNNYISYMKRNHRWHRGDMQIIRWLNPFSPINGLSKWKIFDNLRRPTVYVLGMVAIILSMFISLNAFAEAVLLVFLAINFGTLLSLFDKLIFGIHRHTKELQYIPIIHGFSADLLTMSLNFINLPYISYICVDAFSRSLFRMIFTKKHLLEWTTAETLDKKVKNNLVYYYVNMIVNLLMSLFIIFWPTPNVTGYVGLTSFKVIIGIFILFGPFAAYLLGYDHLLNRRKRLTNKEDEKILEIGKRTWSFFDTLMTKTNNYLPTDNFQSSRRNKIVNRTSSTNIGFGILAIIDAYDLKYIDYEEMVEKLTNTYMTIDSLEKWHGHLYNWYNIKTLEPLRPRFVSTVDSGNFVACLYVAKSFYEELLGAKEFNRLDNKNTDKRIIRLLDLTNSLIDATDFTVLYDTSRNLFSIGYAQEEGKLLNGFYDMLMSESRITSLIAIARRQVTSKHWFALSRNMTKMDGYKGLVSWSGTAFEYYMPYLFSKSYEHTLIDQSLFFTMYSNIKYAKTNNNIPWGISESAFAVKDTELNYQYQAFGVPWLGLKRGLNNFLVVAPYASILMLPFAPQKVYKNILKLEEVGAYGSYGFFKAIDYTKQNLDHGDNMKVVQTYMAHHQGMSLCAINNYINKGILQRRFHRNPDIKATEILLKEREKMKTNSTFNVTDKFNKFKQRNINKYTTHVNAILCDSEDGYVSTSTPKNDIGMLNGYGLSAIYTSNGAEYIKYKDKIVNKQRYKDIATTGNYVFITDKLTGNKFSATDSTFENLEKLGVKKTSFISNLSFIENYIEFPDIEVTTTSFISPEYNVEIRRVSMYNNSMNKREILINTYIELAMTDYMTNVVHPAFSNLQIETYYDSELDTLIASKRKKNENDSDLFVYSKLIGIDLAKEIETEKMKIIQKPEDAYNENIVKYPLWPVLSYRARIILDEHERQDFYYILGASDSKYKISNAIVNLDYAEIQKQFKLTCELNSVIARYLKLEPGRAKVYNKIIKQVLFGKKKLEADKFWDESMNQSMLWKYSISGDLPIILVNVSKIEDAGIVNEVIDFMDYVKNRNIDLDIIILIDEEEEKYGPIYTYIKTRLDRAVYSNWTKGNVYVLNIKYLEKKEINLLSFLSAKYIQNVTEFLPKEETAKLNKNTEEEGE